MSCRAVCCVGSGQRIKQFFNFCLYLCQLHLISCQLWIDLFLSTMAYLEISEPVTHSGKNELFKFFFADFSTARTAFIFCPFGTPEISDAVWNMGGFQGISAMSAFDFSGKPGISRLSAMLESGICHQLLSAFQPCFRGNQCFVGSNHKYLVFQAPVLVLFYIPSLIQITAICSGKISDIIYNGCPLAFEKLVQFQISLCINGVS